MVWISSVRYCRSFIAISTPSRHSFGTRHEKSLKSTRWIHNITQTPESVAEHVEEPIITEEEKQANSLPRPDQNRRRRRGTNLPPPPLPDASEFPSWAYEPRSFFRFEILHQSNISQARVGRIHTPHGVVDTPGFVAVATNAALKGVDFRDANEAGQQLIFANTYHLILHPGADIIKEAGGIHKFTNRPNGPFITDSGGFQVFSLAYGSVHEELESKGELKRASVVKSGWREDVMGEDAVKVSEEGVTFRSYRDGSKFLLTPESTIQAQKAIGADIIIPLDELPPYHIDRELLAESVDRYVSKTLSGAWLVWFT